MFIVKHSHFNICYSGKIINVRTCPDLLFWLLQVVKNAKFSWASPPGPHLEAYGAPPNPQAVVNSLRYLPWAPLVLLILEIRHVLLFIRRSQCCRPEPLKSRKFLLLARESLKRFFKLYQTVFTCIVSPPVIFLRLRMLKLL